MTLRGEHREVIVEWVNYLLDRLFDSVAGDKQAENGLKHELRLQDGQITAWRQGRYLPNASTLYMLAIEAGVLDEINAALQKAGGLQSLPSLISANEETSSDVFSN
jgi:hypothetical protein